MKKNNLSFRISVIIPFYNHGKYINEALKSIQEQTFPAFEVIIVNDCSTDEDSNFLKKLKKGSEQTSVRLQVFQTSKNSGPAVARNIGAKHAKGEYLCFLDADDKIDKTFLEKALLELKKDPVLSFVYSYIQHFDGDDTLHPTLNPYNFYKLLLQNKLPYCAVIRKKDFDSVGGYDEKLNKNESEDWDFWIRMGKQNHFGYCIEEPLFYYRKAENKRLKDVQKHYGKIVKNLHGRHKNIFSWEKKLQIWWCWRGILPKKEASTMASQLFHRLPSWAKTIGFKLYEAELLEFKHWKTHPISCLQCIFPIRWRRRVNQLFLQKIFHEKTRFSEIFKSSFPSQSFSLGSPKVNTTKKKQILVLVPWIPMGGVETVLLHILRKLKKDFDFIVCTTERNENSLHSEFSEIAAVYHLPNIFSQKKEKIDFLLRKIQEQKIKKVFIVNSLFGFKLIPLFKNTFPELSIVTSLHGWDKNFDFLSVAAMYFSFLDSVICVSASVKRKFEEKLEFSSPKIKLIRNVLDIEKLNQETLKNNDLKCLQKTSSQQKNIVFLGRYNFDKNPHFFIDIANFFRADLELMDFRFFLFGEGIEERSLKKRAEEINRHAGRDMVWVETKQKNVSPIYEQADVVLNCSPREGFGMSALEAIYFGVRVVGFDLDVFREILPPQYFFPVSQTAENPLAQFAKQIFAATKNKITQDEKETLRQWVEKNFDEGKFIAQYRDILN